MKDQELLYEIGLTKGEVSCYLALLEIGSSSVGRIIEKARVSSSKIYNILDRLMQKGLVSYATRENVKYFEAASPQRILDYLREKEESIREKSKKVEKILPELLLKEKMSGKEQEISIFSGIKGIKTVHEKTLHLLRKGEEYCFMGASVAASGKLEEYWQDYHKIRQKQQVKARILFNRDVHQSVLANRNSFGNCEARYLPFEASTPSWIEIFKDITILGVVGSQPVALEIRNPDIAKSFQSYFEGLWNRKVEVFEGKDTTRFFEGILTDLKSGEEYFVLNGNYGNSQAIRDFFIQYHQKRMKKGIKVNFLFNHNIKAVVDRLVLPPAEHKFLPIDFASPLQITFYKEKIYISLWGKNPIGFLIHDKKVVRAFRAYFDVLWQQDSRTMKGKEGISTLCEEVICEKADLYLIGANAEIIKTENLFNVFEQKRVALGLKRYHLSTEKTRGMAFNTLPLTQARYLPAQFSSPLVIWVFGKKIAQVLWDSQTIFLLEDEKTAEEYRKYFWMLWESSSS